MTGCAKQNWKLISFLVIVVIIVSIVAVYLVVVRQPSPDKPTQGTYSIEYLSFFVAFSLFLTFPNITTLLLFQWKIKIKIMSLAPGMYKIAIDLLLPRLIVCFEYTTNYVRLYPLFLIHNLITHYEMIWTVSFKVRIAILHRFC